MSSRFAAMATFVCATSVAAISFAFKAISSSSLAAAVASCAATTRCLATERRSLFLAKDLDKDSTSASALFLTSIATVERALAYSTVPFLRFCFFTIASCSAVRDFSNDAVYASCIKRSFSFSIIVSPIVL